MARPAIDYGPWSFDVNNDCSEAAALDTINHALVGLKDSLVVHSAWSVIASSDSSSVKNIGDASPDLWTDWATDIVRAVVGSPHSWVIVENATTGEQICIDVNVTYIYRCDVWYSATGSFGTDGTTSDRPTDTESIRIFGNWLDCFDNGLDGAVVHTMVSNDDLSTRVYVYQKDGTSKGGWFLAFEEVREPTSSWTDTLKRAVYVKIIAISMSTVATSQAPKMVDFDTASWQVYLNDSWVPCYPSCECFKGFVTNAGDAFYKETDSTWSGNRMVQPIGLFNETVIKGGPLGNLGDIYYAPENLFVYDMSDATKQDWIKFGCIQVPWNDTTPTEIT